MDIHNENFSILLKFGDGDGPNLCRVKKVDVSSTFIEKQHVNILDRLLKILYQNRAKPLKIMLSNFFKFNNKEFIY